MKYYIAGPFFNESQLDCIKLCENLIKDSGHEYFSPRSTEAFNNTINKWVKESYYKSSFEAVRRDLVFKKNIEEIDECDGAIINLQFKDIGTAFEYGYIIAKIYYSNNKNYDLITIKNNDQSYLLFDKYETIKRFDSHLPITKGPIVLILSMDLNTIIRNIDRLIFINRIDDNSKIVVDSTNSDDKYDKDIVVLGMLYYVKSNFDKYFRLIIYLHLNQNQIL